MTEETNICCDCNGTGLTNEKPQLCPHGKCEKCENNEGFIIHPMQTCESCAGMGSRDTLYQVCNIK